MLPHCLSGNAGETVKDSGADQNPSHRREKSGAQPIIVPIVLRMAEFDHKVATLCLFIIYYLQILVSIFVYALSKIDREIKSRSEF